MYLVMQSVGELKNIQLNIKGRTKFARFVYTVGLHRSRLPCDLWSFLFVNQQSRRHWLNMICLYAPFWASGVFLSNEKSPETCNMPTCQIPFLNMMDRSLLLCISSEVVYRPLSMYYSGVVKLFFSMSFYQGIIKISDPISYWALVIICLEFLKKCPMNDSFKTEIHFVWVLKIVIHLIITERINAYHKKLFK